MTVKEQRMQQREVADNKISEVIDAILNEIVITTNGKKAYIGGADGKLHPISLLGVSVLDDGRVSIYSGDSTIVVSDDGILFDMAAYPANTIKSLYGFNDSGYLTSASIAQVRALLGIDLSSTVEVLTGEIYNGKPVYAKSVNGNIAPLASGATSVAISTGLSLNAANGDFGWIDMGNSFSRETGAYSECHPLIVADTATNNAALGQTQIRVGVNVGSFTLINRYSGTLPITYNVIIKYVKGS